MTINWTDEGLPTCFVYGAANERRRSFWADDQPEVGAARRRKRFSRSLRYWPEIVTPGLTASELQAVLDFYETTTDSGQEVFAFPSPLVQAGGVRETILGRFTTEMEVVPFGKVWQVKFGFEEV